MTTAVDLLRPAIVLAGVAYEGLVEAALEVLAAKQLAGEKWNRKKAGVQGRICGWVCDLHLERWERAHVRPEVEASPTVPDALRLVVSWAAGEAKLGRAGPDVGLAYELDGQHWSSS